MVKILDQQLPKTFDGSGKAAVGLVLGAHSFSPYWTAHLLVRQAFQPDSHARFQ
jgi:hypothetical protein